MSLTLYINKSDSRCECCYQGVDYRAATCPHCGGTWDTLSSDYSHLAKLIVPMRPDLEPHFPWEGFWDTDEGQAALAELRAAVDLDTTPE